MKNAVNWFEIPVADMARAAAFYEKMLGITLKRQIFGGRDYAVFTFDEGAAGGALVVDPHRKPSAEGVVVYLDARGDVGDALARARAAGGAEVLPKTSIGKDGHIGLVRDTEGNVVGLNTP